MQTDTDTASFSEMWYLMLAALEFLLTLLTKADAN